MKALLDSIPYLRLHGVDLMEAGERTARLELALRPEMTNHVGILHAGALYTLAETAAGVAAVGAVPGALILLRHAEMRYLRPGREDVIATASVDATAAREARADFSGAGRSNLEVGVTVAGRSGEMLLEASFDYALRPGS